jgi:hypothetical protein
MQDLNQGERSYSRPTAPTAIATRRGLDGFRGTLSAVLDRMRDKLAGD